jgi:hypothetical protein
MSLKSFFHKIGSEIEKWFGSATTEQKIMGSMNIVGPFLQTIVTLAGGAKAGAEVSSVLSQIKADFGTVSAIVQQGTAAAGTPLAQSLTTAASSIQANLGAVLTDAGIKNSQHFTTIQTTSNLVIQELEAIVGEFASMAPAPSAPTPQAPAPTPISSGNVTTSPAPAAIPAAPVTSAAPSSLPNL